MREFEQYFSGNEILRYICKMRVKIAKTRNKKHLLNYLTTNPKYNYHVNSHLPARNEFEQYQIQLTNFLSTILPPRRKWVKLGEVSRRHPKNKNEFLTSNDKNFYSLLKTIKLHQKQKSQEQWFLNLQKFIIEIRTLATSESYNVQRPIIFPKLKEDIKRNDINECRPICIFNAKDRIILSITNKFLTQLFDKYFLDCSYAFRAKKNAENKMMSHHDCIRDILKYRKENEENDFFVVECDMKKFYDTVNHKIAKELFYELISKAKNEYPQLKLNSPIRIFESYLDIYAFNVNIPKPSDKNYWESYDIENGEFAWIDEHELFERYLTKPLRIVYNILNINNIFKNNNNSFKYQFIRCLYYIIQRLVCIKNERIGVPQGGALSGLIANLYLNQADIKLSGLPILYQRFCDDMIIISSNLEVCNTAKQAYENTLQRLKLFPHKFRNNSELTSIVDNKLNYKKFWDGKSKGPYQWGKIENNCFPWIGFVGYEVDYQGNIRIRKKSLDKELKKQKRIINEIKNAIEVGMRKPKGTATESAINRLIGMSVGRIGIDNFDEVSTDLCWKNGFQELSLNQHSLRQIKQLDRNRNKLYYKFLKEAKDPELKLDDLEPRQIIKYNKPFSYYYQVLKRQKSE
jgi:hypothetical protein